MPWRVVDLECDIYTVHAAEDYFLERVGQGDNPTILFSRLTRPAISIGRMQNLRKDVDLEEAARLGVDVTRRETGGRSVYLDQYHYLVSIIDRHVTGSRNPGRAYLDRCGQVLHALSNVTDTPFSLQYVNDLVTSQGKKIGGAAQKETAHAALVHCYLRLATDFDTMLRLIKIDDVPLTPYREQFEQFASSLEREAGIDVGDFYTLFRNAFLHSLDGAVVAPLTALERGSIDDIIYQQYGNKEYVHGTGDEPSRGNCDLIAGSGTNAVLKIPELVGKVNFR
jgi:lipoate-protein ligase A